MMNYRTAALALILGYTISTPAMANWIYVGENDANISYVHKDYHTDRDGDKIVWIKYKLKSPKRDVRTGKLYDEGRAKMAIRCSSRHYAETAETAYRNGRKVSSGPERWPSFQSIQPETYPHTIANMVCN